MLQKKSVILALFEKGLKMAFGLVMFLFIARSYPKSDVGVFFFSYTIISLMFVLVNFGLDSYLQRKFIPRLKINTSDLSISILLRVLISCFCFIVLNTASHYFWKGQIEIIFFMSFMLFFIPLNSIGWYFLAKGKSYLYSLSLIAAYITMFAYGFFVFYNDLDIKYFSFVYVLEFFVSGFILCVFYVYIEENRIATCAFKKNNITTLRLLFSRGMPLIISGSISILYMKIDQVMIEYLYGSQEVATYLAATRIVDSIYTLLITIISIVFPSLLLLKCNNSKYISKMSSFLKGIVFLSVGISLVFCFFSGIIIEFIYGVSYKDSAIILSIYSFSIIFVALGNLSSKIYISESQGKILMRRSFFGLIINIVLNFILLISFGVVGAAIATLITQIYVGVLFNVVEKNATIKKITTVSLGFKY
ncbi:TPA: oligosaccharide flippase family protein [Vibrio cholerae]